MYEKQIKLKADSPLSQFAKESRSPALVLHAKVVKRIQNSKTVYF